jgi:hypothetical protein
LPQKRAAMLAHASQATSDDAVRSMRQFVRLPGPLFRAAFGYEWFIENGRPPRKPLLDDVLASLR